jgi:hypothetical protein
MRMVITTDLDAEVTMHLQKPRQEGPDVRDNEVFKRL